MINLVEKKLCCGCSACYSICHKNCIEMLQDEEGFLYPKIDLDRCVNCSLCEDVCPIKYNGSGTVKEKSIYAAVQNKNESIRMDSTAGGAFSVIAEYLIDKGVGVYACGYNDMAVCHKRVDTKDRLGELRGSKYVQSAINNVFKEIDKELKAGSKVLFVGTPCQVQGLKNVVGDNSNLYTIDLLCLGVSSPGLFKKWIKFLESKYSDDIINVQFRNKRYGYSTPNVRVLFKKGRAIEQTYETRVHSKLFFNGYNVRPSCYECVFREYPRVSDFTIGDFYDVGSISSIMDDERGTTRLWAHTEKAKDIISQIADKAKILVINSDHINIVDGKKRKMQIPANRVEFFNDCQTMDYTALVSKWEPETIKDKLIQIIRPIINTMPFHTILFRFVRNIRNVKFEKMVNEINKKN